MVRSLVGAGLVLGLACAVWFTLAQAQQPEPARPAAPNPAADREIELSEFMRKKLDASAQILEGLCTEDLTLVKQGAQALGEMSAAERFRVSNDPLYRQFNADFRQLTQDLIKAADDKNEDRVALKWMDATMSCLDCHRFVRGMRITGVN